MSTTNKDTPVKTNPAKKRKEKPDQSPTQVGDMSIEELMKCMQSTMSVLLDEKLKNFPTKEDLEGISSEVEKLNNIVSELADENALLKDELQQIKAENEKLAQETKHLINASKRKSLIFRGLDSTKKPVEAVNALCKNVMQVTNFQLSSARKIFEKDGKMSVVAELQSEEIVAEVFKNMKKLEDTDYSVERDLSKERQLNKKILLKLKKDLKAIDANRKVQIRDDKMKIGDKWFQFNEKKELRCGSLNGEEVLKSLYKNKLDSYDLSYRNLFEGLNNKQKN